MDIIPLLRSESRERLEAAVEARCLVMPGPKGTNTIIARVLGKYLFVLDQNDLSLTPNLALHGYWEMWITQWMSRYVRKGWRCMDIGANCGYFSVLLCDLVGPKGEVLAWEPQPHLADNLERTLTLNGFRYPMVEVCEQAASHYEGHMEMQLFVDDDGAAMSGSARLVSFGDAAGMEKTLRARVSRPDHHHFASKPVDFVKIDAEGHEPEVWTGLHQIRQNPDFSALIEWAPDRYEDPAWLLDQFAKEGFSTYVVTDASKVAAASRDSLLNVPEFEMVLVVRPGARPL